MENTWHSHIRFIGCEDKIWGQYIKLEDNVSNIACGGLKNDDMTALFDKGRGVLKSDIPDAISAKNKG
ncbi:hypothetical protein EA58_04615 [Photobacterium galatheae]|uniref:Uncharacterized protein n=1 Tax=Photobacterium galatheae TaxID=1654360 RepID=A0A066RZ83_9GAMM|nr:hypothetical protein EA58_04615 [Photobacterium galatheae]